MLAGSWRVQAEPRAKRILIIFWGSAPAVRDPLPCKYSLLILLNSYITNPFPCSSWLQHPIPRVTMCYRLPRTVLFWESVPCPRLHHSETMLCPRMKVTGILQLGHRRKEAMVLRARTPFPWYKNGPVWSLGQQQAFLYPGRLEFKIWITKVFILIWRN